MKELEDRFENIRQRRPAQNFEQRAREFIRLGMWLSKRWGCPMRPPVNEAAALILFFNEMTPDQKKVIWKAVGVVGKTRLQKEIFKIAIAVAGEAVGLITRRPHQK